MIEKIKEAVHYLQAQGINRPQFGIILGTGLGGLIDHINIYKTVDYDQIPHFPISTVESHHGKLILGELSGKTVLAMQGRFHYYEGYDMQQVTFPVRVMKLLGVERLFISNAAGGLNPDYQISDIMLINDHINLLPENPLTGKNLDSLGVRFPDMLDAYDPEMLSKAQEIAKQHGMRTHAGVYASVAGPNLETPAEYRYLRIIGGDAVGMSTIPEVIVARHMNLPIFALSVITDLCYEGAIKHVTVEEVITAAKNAEPNMIKLLAELVATY